MCASYEARFSIKELVDAFAAADVPTRIMGGLPNRPEADEVRPTDMASIVLASEGAVVIETARFGLPASRGRPVVNLRSEGRRFENGVKSGRCLVATTGFYEFTGDRYPKTRWIFRDAASPMLMLAGAWRREETGAAAFALLTTEPGPDIAPYHDRGVVPVAAADWKSWLLDAARAEALVQPAPAGSLAVQQKPRG